MRVLIIGNGGRESAIAYMIKRFHEEAEIFVAPGNGGTQKAFTNVGVAVEEIDQLAVFAKEKNIDLTIVGPEVPLVLGIVDKFNKLGIKTFGPNEACAQFEGSKRFTKEFLMKYNIPTARYQSFTKEEKEACLKAVEEFELPIVVKADGLAAGKGVIICKSYEEAKQEIKAIFDGKFDNAGNSIVVEEFLTGTEASLLCFVDGKTIVPMETARDYKRAYDGDEGLNTGGMGGFSPNPIITKTMQEQIKKSILEPTIKGMQKEGLEFKGVLFIGLMIENNIPKVLEFNVRFGDPETQSVLPRLKTDLVTICHACIEGTLDKLTIEWDSRQSVTVVLASHGYPETSHKGDIITGLEDLLEDTYLFEAGTKYDNEQLVTNGGRVLAITCMGDTIKEAREKVYNEVEKISFYGMHYRNDIAK